MQERRSKGELTLGEKQIKFETKKSKDLDRSKLYTYQGELDPKGKAYGHGKAFDDDGETLEGTFFND